MNLEQLKETHDEAIGVLRECVERLNEFRNALWKKDGSFISPKLVDKTITAAETLLEKEKK